MRRPRPPTPSLRTLCLLLLLVPAFAGCRPSDPLAAVREQQAEGDFEGSIEPLRKLLEERPGDGEVAYLYGRALGATGQPSLAEWPLRRAMEDPAWLVPAGLELANGALGSRNFPVVLEVVDRILAAEPDHATALLMRANARAHSRLDHEGALADAERVLELEPENLEAMEPRILALLGLGRAEEAGRAIEELGKRIEEAQVGSELRGWHCATAALFAEESGEAELAEQRWSECLERYPAHANVVANAIEHYEERRDVRRSIAILRTALEQDPSSREVRVALADRLRLMGAPGEALDLLLEATRAEKPALAAAAWIDVTGHHQELREYRAAAKAAEHALELARQAGEPHADLLFTYADSLVLAGDFDRALAVAEELKAPAHRELIQARVAQERGQAAEALRHFEEAFRLLPNNPWARYYAARAAETLGDFERAIESYRYAIRIAAGATDARVRLARLHLAEGRPAEALQVLRVQAERAFLDLEGELLSLRLWGRLGDEAALRRQLAAFREGRPELLAQTVASAAEGVRERAGAEAALRFLGEVEGLDLSDPRHAEALRALVRLSDQVGRPGEAEKSVLAALRAHPEAADFHEIHGLWLELRGSTEARASYLRALELDPKSARALSGLGRLSFERSPDQAAALFEQAAQADPSDAGSQRDAARALAASGKREAAQARLEKLLAQEPWSADAARELALLQLDAGPPTERTLELARRAVRFGGGAPALELLARVHEGRNEPEQAADAAARARALREKPASGA